MNRNFTKPILDALTRQTSPMDHPSADVLTAFAENVLAGDEYRRTADHLSRCTDCREVVFLASNATDKPLQVEEQQLVAGQTSRRWTPRLVWGMSIAAGVLLAASTLIWWRNESTTRRMQMASRAVSAPVAQPMQQAQESQPTPESNAATAPQRSTEIAVSTQVTKTQPSTSRAKATARIGTETMDRAISADIVAGALPAPTKPAPATAFAAAKAAPTVPNADSSTVTIGGTANFGTAAATPATPHVNSFAAVQGGPVGTAPGSMDKVLLNPQTARALRPTHPQWRISADGHLEHSTADVWTRVLADQTATFRVVSVVGDQVWAGGTGGALFHSYDDGQNWEQAALIAPNGRETGIIVSIQFNNAQRGIVTTDSGTRYLTIDGGWTWIRLPSGPGNPK